MTDKARPLVLLDRDGVINRDSVDYIKSPAEWQPLPGSLEAIARLTQSGFNVAVITNQSGIARGLFDRAMLEAIHEVMHAAVRAAGGQLAGIYYCPHHPDDGCSCRKPQPGLLLQAISELSENGTAVAFIGDKPSDVGAARAANVQPILITESRTDDSPAGVLGFANLDGAVSALIDERGSAQ